MGFKTSPVIIVEEIW